MCKKIYRNFFPFRFVQVAKMSRPMEHRRTIASFLFKCSTSGPPCTSKLCLKLEKLQSLFNLAKLAQFVFCPLYLPSKSARLAPLQLVIQFSKAITFRIILHLMPQATKRITKYLLAKSQKNEKAKPSWNEDHNTGSFVPLSPFHQLSNCSWGTFASL